ncbi:hypothetical protein SAMN05428949_1745 [Chitinophaga sp. YR627]|nr:hypothetical protein SAMN05428949_1745 [Chitinophaga sp. YR627]
MPTCQFAGKEMMPANFKPAVLPSMGCAKMGMWMLAGNITSNRQNNANRIKTVIYEMLVNGREIMKDEWILHFKRVLCMITTFYPG